MTGPIVKMAIVWAAIVVGISLFCFNGVFIFFNVVYALFGTVLLIRRRRLDARAPECLGSMATRADGRLQRSYRDTVEV